MGVGVKICRALLKLVQTQFFNLVKLNLDGSDFNDECIKIVVEIVHRQRSLRSLSLSSTSRSSRSERITEIGWKSLAALMMDENCNLEEVFLMRNCVSDELALVFASALTSTSKIKTLGLAANPITANGWSAFKRVLCETYRLEDLWIVNINRYGNVAAAVSSLLPRVDNEVYMLKLSCNQYNDHGVDALLSNLHNDRLRKLDLSCNILITTEMWHSLASLLENTCASLEELYLNKCSIDDAMLNILVIALRNSRLCCLDLSSNGAVTARGWHCVASLFESDHLHTLLLDDNNIISDEEALHYSNSLRRNDKLVRLSLSWSSITEIGWSSFFNVLCNASSINSIFESNHMLGDLGLCDDEIAIKLQQNLALNRLSTRVIDSDSSNEIDSDENDSVDSDNGFSKDQSHVAIMKIINTHRHFDMSPFFEWDYKVLPVAMNWFKRARSFEAEDEGEDYLLFHPDSTENAIDYDLPTYDCPYSYQEKVEREKLYCVYQFVRAMPNVFEPTAAKRRRLRKYYHGTKYNI
ncbi:hypothetical protein ACHAWF_008798 [Thalassiosira exigua]